MPLRYTFALLGILLTLIAPARAQTYIEFFEFPEDTFLHGLDYHDGFLWAPIGPSSDPRILQIDPDDGSIVGTVSIAGDFDPHGVTWDGENFRVSESYTSSPEVFTVSPTGEVLGQIPAPSNLSNGLAFHDGMLFVAKAYPDEEAALIGVDPDDGSVLETIPFPATQPGGIAFLGDGTLWTTNVGDDSGPEIEVLWKLDRATGDVLDTLAVPTDAGRPRGLAYDGSRYLYAVMDEPGGFEDVIYKIDLSTEGTPVYSATTTEVDFGLFIIGTGESSGFSFQNTGDAPLVVSDVEIVGPDAALFATPYDGGTVEPGTGNIVVVTFDPENYGPRTATLRFATNDVANQMVEIALSGLGVFPEQTIAFVDASINFGEVRIENPYGGAWSVSYEPLEIINQGAEPLEVSDISSPEGETFPILAPDLPFTIGSADTVTVQVGFRPLKPLFYDGSVFVESDDPDTPSALVTVTGTGIDPEIDGGDTLWTLTVPDNPSTVADDFKVTHLAPAGDLTGDGKDDLIVGTENYLVFAVNGDGWGTGDILWSFDTCPDNSNCGAVSGVDGAFETALETGHDLDGDGTPDVVFSTDGGNDHVYALSGADGSVIWEVGSETDPYLASYYSVSARFDVTGDGVPDVATGTGTASANSPDPFNDRRVYGLDGATGAELWEHAPGLPSFVVEQIRTADGEVLAVAGGAGEIDGFVTAWTADDGTFAWTHTPETTPFVMAPYPREDGGEDLIYTGATETNDRIVRLDGTTGDVVWQRAAAGLAWAVAVPGDLNGNGSADIAVGLSSDLLRVFDGADGEPLWNAGGFTQVFGVAALPDITGDGLADLAAATGDSRALLLSGADGEPVWSYTIGDGTLDQAAEVVAVLPDIDGNGAPEIAVGSRHGRLALLASTGDVLTATDDAVTPAAFALDPNYPNPFGATTTIGYTLPEAADVRLTVYNLLGQRVRTLVAQPQAAGTYHVAWDGRDAAGTPAASGVYLYRLEVTDPARGAGAFSETRRMVLVR